MSGSTKSADQKLQEMEHDLESFLARKGLFDVVEPKASEFVNISRDRLASLPPDELGVIGFELARYAFYLQQVMNMLQTRVNICKEEIRKAVGHKIKEYTAVYGREDKWIAAIAESPHASKWKEIQDKAQFSLDRIAYFPSRLIDLSKTVLELQQTGRRTHGKV